MVSTFLEVLGSDQRSSCGYCKDRNGSKKEGNEEATKEETKKASVSTGSAWAHRLCAADYSDLLDMGWRRSGRYLYKPSNRDTCCPQYTIRLDVTKFKMSRSQKRVLRQMNEFLATGKRPVCGVKEEFPLQEKETTSSEKKIKKSKDVQESAVQEPAAKKTKDTDRPVLKKKEIRNKRFEEKCLLRNLNPEEVRAERRQKDAARQRTIQSFIDEAKPEWKHKLELKLVPANSEEFESRANESFELYKKYQQTIHNDECSFAGFRRFLCNSPLTPETTDGVDLGSFHLWFLLDGKLIAVCVVDVLPICSSAKYMYYDPDYSFLSIGTYTALREIEMTQRLQKTSSILKYYYMGYYIHSCPKMRYKAKFRPSDLLCDKSFEWLELDKCRPLLDASELPNGFAEFHPEKNRPVSFSIDTMLVIVDAKVRKYKDILEQMPELNDRENKKEVEEKMKEMADLVGPNLWRAAYWFEELNNP